MLLFDLFYCIFLILLAPFLGARLMNRDFRSHFRQRLSPAIPIKKHKTVWIHAVSVGEVKGIAALIERISRESGRETVLTVSTLSGYCYARKAFPAMDVLPAPLDFTFSVRRYISHLNPALLVLNELEIWPNWLTLLNKKKIPVLLINGRISDHAYRRYYRYRRVLRPFFCKLDTLLVQNEEYRRRFVSMGIPEQRIIVSGTVKAEEAEQAAASVPPGKQVYAHLGIPVPQKPVLVFASTHPEDEQFFLPLLSEFTGSMTFILVPRHPRRSTDIRERLETLGVHSRIWSQQDAGHTDSRLLIYDRIGYLVPIMSVADLVFMGGTFNRKTGGHNYFEPAALGKPIVSGPFYGNFPDIAAALRAKGVLQILKNPEDFSGFLKNIDKLDRKKIAGAAGLAVQERKGATECSIQQIVRLAGV